jgi:hypothetical protein
MSLLQNSNAIPTGVTGYNLTDSVRFRQSASARLSRTFASTGTNNKIQTFSAWVKRGLLSSSTTYRLMGGYDGSSSNSTEINFNNDNLRIEFGGAANNALITTQVFRDSSAWYHIVIAIDTTQATSSNRIKMYVNGSQITAFGTANYPSQNAVSQLTSANANNSIGAGWSGFEYFDGYITEFNFVDGQALTPSDFGEYDDDTGVWKPKEYTGTYGTNGFYLPMKQTTQAEGFNTVTYTGTGTSGTKITGVGFQPDLVWVKNRDQLDWHHLFDSVRGVSGGRLSSNDTAAEYYDAQQLQSFDADGYTYGTSHSGNASGEDYVAWCWEAGGTAVANTDGDIASQVSANTAKGFSVVTYTGNLTSSGVQTVGHGLGIAPSVVIAKSRDSATQWTVQHTGTSSANHILYLNTTDAQDDKSSNGSMSNPTTDVFSTNWTNGLNVNGEDFVAYCFAEVSGFSKFGSYTGNGTSQSINLGFRPAFVMWKRIDAAGNSWIIKDNTRYADNQGNLFPNATTAENTDTSVTFTDTGFDVDSAAGYNGSGRVFIYMAFADTRDFQWNFDASGNKNNFTPNNINSNASSETTYDIMSDVPTLTDEDTGNFCTLNPLIAAGSVTVSLANLKSTAGTNAQRSNVSTIAVSSGKYYWETTWNQVGANDAAMTGIIGVANLNPNSNFGGTNSYAYVQDGAKQGAGSYTAGYGDRYVAGDVIGTALDLDGGTITFYRNGVSQGTAFTSLPSVEYHLGCSFYNSGDNFDINFGQRPFAYTPPTGYKKLNTYNLPDSAVKDGSQYMNTVTYDGSASDQSITGVGFEPDLVWVKCRDVVNSHVLSDSVRGSTGSTMYFLSSDTTNAESSTNQIKTIDSDGFTVWGDRSATNRAGQEYVAWNWRGSDSTAATISTGSIDGTNPTIASTVSANTTSGFSVVTYTGNGTSGATIGHGLGAKPAMIIEKNRDDGADSWAIYHKSLATTSGQFLLLNSTAAVQTNSVVWNNTEPTSSVFTVGTGSGVNGSGENIVAYCFAEVEGFSKFGSWETVNVGGTPAAGFVYTGFRPKLIIWKAADASTSYTSWGMQDTERTTYNGDSETLHTLWANGAYAEGARGNGSSSGGLTSNGFQIDFLSNGFNIRGGANDELASSGTYIYMAWAENPFKNSLAR